MTLVWKTPLDRSREFLYSMGYSMAQGWTGAEIEYYRPQTWDMRHSPRIAYHKSTRAWMVGGDSGHYKTAEAAYAAWALTNEHTP